MTREARFVDNRNAPALFRTVGPHPIAGPSLLRHVTDDRSSLNNAIITQDDAGTEVRRIDNSKKLGSRRSHRQPHHRSGTLITPWSAGRVTLRKALMIL